MIRVAGIEPITEVEGPGRRFALWLQGCSRLCSGCCNPHMQDHSGGNPKPVAEIAAAIIASPTEGLTLLGGEPLEQVDAVKQMFDLLDAADYSGNIMLFSGFTWQEIGRNPEMLDLVRRCDCLVAGPFVAALKPDSRRWIGSRNQTVHFFRDRLDALKLDWPKHKAEIEIHLGDGEISINGFPVGAESDFEKIFAQALVEAK